MPALEVVVVGSGPAGAHSAWPLVAAGRRVAMVDGGVRPEPGGRLEAPVQGFLEMRRNEPEQFRWFLGEDLTAIPVSGLATGPGSQLAGNRGFVVRDADRLLPIECHGLAVAQTLAKGGFGSVWGGTCDFLTPAELEATGLPPAEMEVSYRRVSERIGLSGPPGRPAIQPAIELDHHARAIIATYQRRRIRLQRQGIAVSQPYTALLTAPRPGREATSYSDLEYWTDSGRSLYRAQYTVEEMEARDNFQYLPGRLVETVTRDGDTVVVRGRIIATGKPFDLRAAGVVMAAGAVGSARVLLRSLGLHDQPQPFLAKQQVLIACLRLASVGQIGPDRRSGLCQLLVQDHTPERGLDSASVQLYGYRSLQIIRLLSGMPLPLPEALDLLSLLAPSMVIADVRFPTFAAPGRRLTLRRRDGGDVIEVRDEPGGEEPRSHRQTVKRVRRALRSLGLVPTRSVPMIRGSTVHYAGTIPASSDDPGLPLSADPQGRLRQLPGVYVADGSVFRCLPAKSPALTFMANADRIGRAVLRDLEGESGQGRASS